MASQVTPLFFWTLLLAAVSGLYTQQLTPTVQPVRYAQVLNELSKVTAARERLANMATQYRQTLNAIKTKQQKLRDTCSCYNTPEVAFNAFLADDVSTFGISQPLPFDNVTVNVGNGYDTRHSQFRAPINGTYQFFITLATKAAYKLEMDVVLNGNIITKIRTGNSYQTNSGTNGLILHMNKGDDLWVQHDSKVADSNRLFKEEGLMTSFSGYLLAKK